MQYRVQSTTGERAWSEGEQLGNGQFLPKEITSYWIEVFVKPTAAQREAGRTRNIPIAVPVMSDWSMTRIRQQIADYKRSARLMDPNAIETDNAYVLSETSAEDEIGGLY